jgi:hypothetical protein
MFTKQITGAISLVNAERNSVGLDIGQFARWLCGNLGELPQKSHTSLILSALGRIVFRHLHQFQSGFLLAMRLSKGKYDGTMAQCVASIGVCQIPTHLASDQS